MYTRAEYMSFKTSDEMTANHRRYYGEIADEIKLRLPAACIAACALALAWGDQHLNHVPKYRLAWWDSMVPTLRGASAALRARGDWLSLGTGVCILKEAARRAAEAEIVNRGGVEAVLAAEAARVAEMEASA